MKAGDELERILLDMRAERSCSRVASRQAIKIRSIVHDRVGALDVDLRTYISGILRFAQPPPGVVLERYAVAGQLWKKGSIHRNWTQRYFLFDLRERQFCYFSDATMQQEKGRVNLEDITAVDRDMTSKQYPYLMNIATRGGRVYHFRSDSEEILNIWLVAFDSVASAPK